MIQFNIFKKVLKKDLLYVIFFFAFLFGKIVVMKYSSMPVEESVILSLLGCSFDNVELLMMYKYVLLIFLIYDFYTHEARYLYDLVLLRVKPAKWKIQKICFTILMIALFYVLHFLVVYLFFPDSLTDITTVFLSVFFEILLACVTMFSIDLFPHKSLTVIVPIASVFVMFNNFNFIVYLVLIPIFLVTDFLFYIKNTKRILNKY